MKRLTIYQKPTCTTCRQVVTMLRESGIDFDAVNYYFEPLTKTKLKELLKKMGIPARELMRTKEPIYRKLNIAGKDLTENEVVDLMVRYPDLIQRPIVEKGTKAILARPPERLKEIL